MVALTQHLADPALSKMAQQAGNGVTQAIFQASERTGADFAYLMEKASAESSFRPDVQAKTSSARGLFQFIDSTWLRMVKNYGHKHGMEHYANMIDGNGRVSDPGDKQKILSLRDNPEKAALMAAEFAAENKRILESRLDGPKQDIGATELYLAHFLGAGGASKFLNTKISNPDANAAEMMPAAAKANQRVFYNTDGSARSVQEIYDFFAKKFKNANSQLAKTSNQQSMADPPKAPQQDRVVRLSAYQKAFIPHQTSFDTAIRQLLLSPSMSGESKQSAGFFSGSFSSLLDMTFMLEFQKGI